MLDPPVLVPMKHFRHRPALPSWLVRFAAVLRQDGLSSIGVPGTKEMNILQHQLDQEVMLLGPELLTFAHSIDQLHHPPCLLDFLQLCFCFSGPVAMYPRVAVALLGAVIRTSVHPAAPSTFDRW